ncbi:GlxA family transcriptional regulator [Defluviimonas sp. WL0075]|uniref:GlxA family transcriptional regulator n=2 Tax=Albidovulum sediminicola TaxID=2984331 RepID=A0ABT2Z6M6_9RHOB|nr:GlxA family transcriptional regulator [Defluviimonas sp. WL0075]
MIEPLRAANEIAGVQAFQWRILSEDGARVASSAQVVFDPDLTLSDAGEIDYLFLLSSPTARFIDRKSAEGHLRRLARHGTAVGGVSGGVFPLARTGLLDGHAVSVHWCYEAAFAQEFPDLRMRDDVIVFDHPRYTVSGAAASFDLMLSFIEDRLGAGVATEVACWFQHPVVRGRGVRQKTPTFRRDSTADLLPGPVAKAVEILNRNISSPIAIEELAESVGVSPRQLERQFKKATGQSPSRYYRTIRMKAARQLVLFSRESMARVAAAVGYETVAPLLRHYREEFGLNPAEDRDMINRFRVEDNRPLPSA